MPLHITPAIDAAIRAHAARDYPHECCGFLIGKANKDTTHVERMEIVKNDWELLRREEAVAGIEDSRSVQPTSEEVKESTFNRFEIDPGELVKIDRAARAEGLSVLGFYHSHPDAPAVPSNFDREHAWPGYCYVIIAVAAGQPREMNNWLLRDDRSGFDPDPIVLPGTDI